MVVVGIVVVNFAVLDHWYKLLVALFPLASGMVAAVAVLADRPKGYIQRVASAFWASPCSAAPWPSWIYGQRRQLSAHLAAGFLGRRGRTISLRLSRAKRSAT